MPRHFLSTTDLTREGLTALVVRAREMKARGHARPLAGRSAALVFLNPSLRTRVSFEVGIHQLGGHAVDLAVGGGLWDLEAGQGVVMDGDRPEHAREAVGVLSRYVDLIGVRAFPRMRSWTEDRADPVLAAFARYADVPVFNMESCRWHPCQALADIMTIHELLGEPQGRRLTLTWAWHPKALPTAVPASTITAAAQFGMEVVLARPEGWDLDRETLEEADALARANGGSLRVTDDPLAAMDGAQVVYAKSWGSLDPERYGKPAPPSLRSWMVDEARMERTEGAWFMHCLPVRRNVVASDAVLEGARSAVLQQAENRLHAQKAMLEDLVTEGGSGCTM